MSTRLISCELWQLSQVGSFSAVTTFAGQWTLLRNSSSMPLWQVPQVAVMRSALTEDAGSSSGSAVCAV